jgi:hypothetical protein
MSRASEDVHLVVSVGGSKCAFAVVGANSRAVLARSRRVEWTGTGIETTGGFVSMLVREFRRLLTEQVLDPARVQAAAMAWPGPQVGECVLATFIPGCQVPQPISRLLQQGLGSEVDRRLESIPVYVMLDAVARAAGESTPGGALHLLADDDQGAGILVNIATGIAGGVVHQGKPLLAYREFGPNYGQFGRFLFLNAATGTWTWRATLDGSVPPHPAGEIRWTHRCAGPALSLRTARWCHEHRLDTAAAGEAVAQALRYYDSEGAPRDAGHEMALLRWASTEAGGGGALVGFLDVVAAEIGGALDLLLHVFQAARLRRIVLAGGVGENFGRGTDPAFDPLLARVQGALGNRCEVRRASLGVDAEFLGLAAHCAQSIS